MKTTEWIMIEIDGWEIEIELPIEYHPNPGYPQTRWEPGEPAHIEEILFSENEAISMVADAVQEIVDTEKIGITIVFKDVLEAIQIQLDEDDILHAKLLHEADQERIESEAAYYEHKLDEMRGL